MICWKPRIWSLMIASSSLAAPIDSLDDPLDRIDSRLVFLVGARSWGIAGLLFSERRYSSVPLGEAEPSLRLSERISSFF